ncbi:hypothetical protein MMC26_007227 [Xylographa opegraphella]|nr:hypothetical protein [Xylographa opegraphella]
MQLPISSSIALLALSTSIAAYAYPSMYSTEHNLAERDAYPSIYSDEYHLTERDAYAAPEPYQAAHQFYERDFDEDRLFERELALRKQLFGRELTDLRVRNELVARAANGCHTCKKGDPSLCKVGGHIRKDAKGKAKAWASGPCPAKEAAPAAE